MKTGEGSIAADSWIQYLDQRPILVVLAGSNGAGKSTFFEAHLRSSGLRFINADVLARELDLAPYDASRVAGALCNELIQQRESFVFETVFSDPAGDKLAFFKRAAAAGFAVVLCFIGISGPEVSEQRVSMRVSQGGHDVPNEKLLTRFPRTIQNLQSAIRELPCVLIFDNDDLRYPFRHVAVFQNGQRMKLMQPLPKWLAPLLQ